MTSKYRPIGFILVVLFSLFSSFCFAEEEKQWTLSAVEFSYTQDKERSEYEKAILSAIPKLILEQAYGIQNRNVPDKEIYDRKVNDLVKERLGLFLELSKEFKLRDSLVLQSLSEYQYNKQLKASEKKVNEIQTKLEKNLEAQDAVLLDFKNLKGDFVYNRKREEQFSLYNNDSAVLYSPKKTLDKADLENILFSSEMVDAHINGLITGSIVTYGQYAAVSVEMFTYPGASSTGVITEIGNISNIENIAKNIAYRLIPKIENSIPCDITIKFADESLRKKAVLTVDSTVYNPVPDKLILSSGVHNLSFECQGYRRESFSYGFGYEKKYLIEIEFVEGKAVETAVVLKKPVLGNIFYNGEQAEDNVISVKINNSGVLGYYYTENENTVYFMIPKNQVVDGNAVELNITDFDVGENIEKRRKMMYISYSALICSLPFLFYSYSNYSSMYNAMALGNRNLDMNEFQQYQVMSYVGIGISVGIGIWFVVELVRYLSSANKALPVEAKKSEVQFGTAVEEFKLQLNELKQQNTEEENKIQE